jgi:hypothetical protein
MNIEKFREKLEYQMERIDERGFGEVAMDLWSIFDFFKKTVESLNDEMISPKRWVSMNCLIKWLLEQIDGLIDEEEEYI